MTKQMSWSKFWWKDWQNDKNLRLCSLGARGLWMEMLALMHESREEGYLLVSGRQVSLRQLAGLINAPEKDVVRFIEELRENEVFSETNERVIFSRRMTKDKVARDQAREFGLEGGNPALGGNSKKRGKTPKNGGNNGGNKPQSNGGDIAPDKGGVNPPLNLQEARSSEVEGKLALSNGREAPSSKPQIPVWIPLDAWNGYIDMRRRARKAPTDRAISMLIDKLLGFKDRGFDVASVLDQSTIAGWTDLYEPKAGKASGGQGAYKLEAWDILNEANQQGRFQ